MAALALQLAWPTDFGRRRPRGFSELRSLATSRPCACIPSTCPALSIHSLPLPSSSLSAPVCLSGVPAPWPSRAELPAGHRSSYSQATPLPSWSSSLCSPHGRTDHAAVMATLADGAAKARGPLSSTAAGQRRARPPPGPGKPPCRCRLSRPNPADPSCDLLQSLKKRTPGTSRSNSRNGKVLTAKSVTQMNSADKDPFAVNLLNLWKFIVIHRKFVK